MPKWKIYVDAGFLLALALIFQSIRLIFPMVPKEVSMFLIGSLVNMCLLLAVWRTQSYRAALIALVLPTVAFLQGQLPLIFMIPVVALGTWVYAVWGLKFQHSKLLWFAPLLKMAILLGGTLLVLQCFSLPPAAAKVLTLMMSWPQLITGVLGLVLAKQLVKYLGKSDLMKM